MAVGRVAAQYGSEELPVSVMPRIRCIWPRGRGGAGDKRVQGGGRDGRAAAVGKRERDEVFVEYTKSICPVCCTAPDGMCDMVAPLGL